MKNTHGDNKFILIESLTDCKTVLATDGKKYLYLSLGKKPLFVNRGNIYIAEKFTLKYPYVFVTRYSVFEGGKTDEIYIN
jgi:hypothetical protein